LVVEHLARITEAANVDPLPFKILSPAGQAMCGLTGFVVIALACDLTGQIEHVEFGRRVTQQMGEVPESLGVL
jgi:hypothetical protein